MASAMCEAASPPSASGGLARAGHCSTQLGGGTHAAALSLGESEAPPSPSPMERGPGGEAATLLPLPGSAPTAISLHRQQTTIGRAPDCHVVLDDPAISRWHATVERRDGQCRLRDAGSLNGTFVNGRLLRPHEWVPLRHGDEVRLASLPFRFVIGMSASSHSATAFLRLDDAAAEVHVGSTRVDLAPKEYALLRALWRYQGRTCSKEWLAQVVWPEAQGIISDASIEATVSRLRRKLQAAGGRREWVVTRPRRGYQLVADYQIHGHGEHGEESC